MFDVEFCIDEQQSGVRMNVTFDSKMSGGGRRVFISNDVAEEEDTTEVTTTRREI